MRAVTLGLGLEGSHILVTGAAGFIGSETVSAFLSAGAYVSCLDTSKTKLDALAIRLEKQRGEQNLKVGDFQCIEADISNEQEIEAAFGKATAGFGGKPVQCCVALAALDLSVLLHRSLFEMSLDQWKRTFDVNVAGTFLTARTWIRQLRAAPGPMALNNLSLVIVGSESGTFGERLNADYASSKSALQGGMLQSLKAEVAQLFRGARVNAIAPGPVDTPQFQKECVERAEQYYEDARATVALGMPVPLERVARSILYLASEEWSGSVHGQVLSVDGGKQGKLMWAK